MTGLWLVLTVLGLGACKRDLPDPSSEAYREAVAAFYTGLAAVQVGEDQRADALLLRVTELAPGEPAAWANLGLLALRRNAFDVAAERLEQARRLAPDNSDILLLIGLGENIQGRYDAAKQTLRAAVARDSTSLRALYALAQAEAQGATAEGAATAFALLDRILARRPDNLAVLVERARLAVQAGDADALRTTLTRLDAQAADWPEVAREQLAALKAAGPGAALTPVTILRNVLLRTPAYRQSLAAVQTPVEQVGELISRFLRLPAPRPTPAPPDDSLAFMSSPWPGEDRTWQALRPLLLNPNGNPDVLAVSGTMAHVLGSEHTLAFPAPVPPGDALVGIDFDNDFFLDVALVGSTGFRLYRQDSTGAFVDVTRRLGLPAGVLTAPYTGAWAVDLDLEGDLDLLLARSGAPPLLLRNNGDRTFDTGQPFDVEATAFAWADFDADGDPDAAFVDAAQGVHRFENRRGGVFEAVPLPGLAARALTAADLDADAVLDLLVLRTDGVLVRGTADGWTEVARWDALPAGPARLFAVDLDNNGGLDVLAAAGAETRLWLSDADGRLHPQITIPDVHVFGFLDVTDDGRLDLVGLDAEGHAVRLINQGTKPYHWRQIRPQAAAALGDQRINSFGIGGEIELRAGLLFQKQPITGPVVYFGLGESFVADVARIIWPNGDVQAEFDLLADEVLSARQRLKGSCPWLFTWDGQQMQFVTDFLWRSPLGLKINAQETAGIMTTEDRVLIRGDQLVPHDGFYDVRITAELWETHFFDHVSLMVVDHPAGTGAYVDERFVFPPPALDVRATGPLHPVARAIDDRGHDVTEIVHDRDERYLDTFGRGPYQGITRDHYVEVDLGDDVPGDAWLVASGWVRPTDSSINVALGQGTHARPQGLRLEVPDGAGGWTVAQSGLGFPSGKEKTLLIDLNGVFRPGTPRLLRLATNLEVYWDALAWAEKRPETPLRTQRLAPATADLRYRGFSVVTTADRSSPERPDYQALAGTVPVWRDLIGYYTRFGDVRELLEGIDDRYVIMNAGDELAFRFPVPPPPPDGWRRDFVLIGDGWVKDGDYNTAFSKTVLPLPSHDRPEYTAPPGRLEDDPVYQRHAADWQTYHTRYVSPDRFAQALRVPRAGTPLSTH